jgi:dihydrodipicolinate synthase/N-acetylneuraminate lyase
MVALLTPITAQGELDVAALDAHVAYLIDEEVDGFFLCGTTGEGPLLRDDEVAQATRAVVEASQGRAFVTTQVGRASTSATARLLRLAVEAGAQGVTAVAPYYYELDDAQLEKHYAELLDVSGETPLFAYTIPRRTGNDLSPELVRRLALRGLAGIKDSTRSMERHAEYLQIAAARPDDAFGVYMGSDALARLGLEQGSDGIVSAVANLRPDLLVRLLAAVREGRPDDARAAQSEIDQVRATLPHSAIEGLKAGVAARLASRGVSYSRAVRPPLGLAAR